MVSCEFCGDVTRTKNQTVEHYERFHQPPILKDDGTIQINACHQIELVLKGDKTWEQLKTEQRKNDKKFKRIDKGA